jgi:uncharacterized protein
MHYFIDGYNLLFRTSWKAFHSNLEDARKTLIREIDTYAALLHFTITIVFDAPFQSDELSRSHFRNLEIIFTSKGLTADDYLVDFFSHAKEGTQYTLVTSDKVLSQKVKCLHIKTVRSEDFIDRLRKSSHKKMLLQKRSKPQEKLIKKAYTAKPDQKKELYSIYPDTKSSLSKASDVRDTLSSKKNKKNQAQELPSLGDLGRWEEIFESRFLDLQKEKGRKK